MTNNQAANSVALLPLAVGFAYGAVRLTHEPDAGPEPRPVLRAVALALLLVSAADVVAFHQRVNLRRLVHDYVDLGSCAVGDDDTRGQPGWPTPSAT